MDDQSPVMGLVHLLRAVTVKFGEVVKISGARLE